MPQFQLDTSGAVAMPINHYNNTAGLTFGDLDPFTQGYIEALFFTVEDDLTYEDIQAAPDGTPPARQAGFSDLAPCALASIIADCEAFQRDNAATLAEAYTRDYDAEQAGRDYWFTRNGHGVGFWDREALEPDSAEYEEATAAVIAARRHPVEWDKAVDARDALKAESLGERLSAASGRSEVSPYLGDDGKVYLS